MSNHTSRTPNVICSVLKAHSLGRQLGRAVADQVGEVFLQAAGQLAELVAAARAGRLEEVELYSEQLQRQAVSMEEGARAACTMSHNSEGVKATETDIDSSSGLEKLHVVFGNRFVSSQLRLKILV